MNLQSKVCDQIFQDIQPPKDISRYLMNFGKKADVKLCYLTYKQNTFKVVLKWNQSSLQVDKFQKTPSYPRVNITIPLNMHCAQHHYSISYVSLKRQNKIKQEKPPQNENQRFPHSYNLLQNFNEK